MKNFETFTDFVGELNCVYRRTKMTTFTIKSSTDAVSFMKKHYEEIMDDHEEFKVLHLDRKNGVVNIDHHSSGIDSSTLVSVKSLVRKAILIKTSGIILFHNHPSGNLNPSNEDIAITKKIKKACELFDINVLDHIILTRESHYSFNNNSLI